MIKSNFDDLPNSDRDLVMKTKNSLISFVSYGAIPNVELSREGYFLRKVFG